MNRELVVAQIVQHMAPGGIETMVLDLQSQAPSPNNVHIISLEADMASATANWPKLSGVDQIHFLGKQPGIQLSDINKLAQLLKQLKVDVVHSHHVGPMLYGGLAAKLARCHHVHTEHDAWHLNNLKRRLLVGAFFHLLRPCVVADAKLVAKNIHRHIPLLKSSVIMNGINTDHFQPGNQEAARRKLPLPRDAPVIGCAARLTDVKSHDVLIRAFSQIPTHCHLALAGGGELEQELRELSIALKVNERVHFLGVVQNMPEFFHAIDLFCLASKREGLPLSPLEAQSCGRNVVLTDVGGCSEATGPDGLLVKAGDIQGLAEALTKQIENSCSSESRERARNFVLKHGNLNRMIEQYWTLYDGGQL